MSLLAPWMLFGIAGVAVPLMLHFFYRARYQPLPWAAMQFLRTSMEQTSRRLRFQEWILLILRILALLILAIALARPATKSGGGVSGRGEAVDAILLIDNSMSMGTQEGAKTRLDMAKEAAIALVDDLPPNSTIQIVTCSDRTSYLGPKSPTNLDQAKQSIQSISITQQSTDFLAGFTEVLEGFKRSQAERHEVYLFSDMQKLGFERNQISALRARCQEIKNQASLIFVRCSSRPAHNVSITGIHVQSDIPHTKTRVPFTVFLRNGSNESVPNLNVSLEVNGKQVEQDNQVIESIGPGETRAISLTAKLAEAGWTTLTARVKSDDLELDNRYDRIIMVRDFVRVLVIDGGANSKEPEKASSFFLGHALLPVPDPQKPNYHVQVKLIEPKDATAEQLLDTDICIIVNANFDRGGLAFDFLSHLAEWVRKGHGLLIAPGNNTKPESCQAMLGPKDQGGVDLLPVQIQQLVKMPEDKPLLINLSSIPQQSFLNRFAEYPLNQIAKVETNQFLLSKELPAAEGSTETSQVLIRYSDGNPMVVSKRAGEGEVIFVTTSFDLSWGIFPVYPQAAFEPFIQAVVTHLLQRAATPYNRIVGKPIEWNPPEGNHGYILVNPQEERIHLGRPTGGVGTDVYSITVRDTPRAGIYRLSAEGSSKSVAFALIPDLLETVNMDLATDTEIDTYLGFQPIHLNSTTNGEPISYAAERSRNEWTTVFLVILFLLALGEMGWAFLCGRAW